MIRESVEEVEAGWKYQVKAVFEEILNFKDIQ